MTSNPNQDLTFFKPNSIISDDIINSNNAYLSVITNTQGVLSNWLINSLIENSLQGTANLINRDLTKKQLNRTKVTYISFTNNKEFYVKNLKRNGIDVNFNQNFEFIDYFTNLFINKIKTDEDIPKLFDMKLDPKTVLFVENPEILLYSTNLSSNRLLSHILSLSKQCAQTFIIASKDLIDMENTTNDPQDLGFKLHDFLTKLYHRSIMNINLQPLKTGRAKDITGSLTVSKGSIPSNDLIEKEYVYNITKDGNLKIYYR
ncbi:unnamed protein product [Candida verbasci]|uniref:Elongator complex protein 6 n=1 Tax=Candida verbasci TaxID=1227364 RepID=A0A9W4XMP7_9ASCO|nr:unnamed protein product [Candida verbasci]